MDRDRQRRVDDEVQGKGYQLMDIYICKQCEARSGKDHQDCPAVNDRVCHFCPTDQHKRNYGSFVDSEFYKLESSQDSNNMMDMLRKASLEIERQKYNIERDTIAHEAYYWYGVVDEIRDEKIALMRKFRIMRKGFRRVADKLKALKNGKGIN